jgi:hypothetical protein
MKSAGYLIPGIMCGFYPEMDPTGCVDEEGDWVTGFRLRAGSLGMFPSRPMNLRIAREGQFLREYRQLPIHWNGPGGGSGRPISIVPMT